jgi:outer membrane protein
MKNQRIVMALLAGVLAFTLFSAVSLQAEIYKLSMGAGVGLAPDYEGSDDYTGTPMLFGEAVWDSGRYLKLDGSKLRANILSHERFRFGPVANYRLGRDDAVDVDDDRVKRMKKVDDSFELGAFAGIQIDNWSVMLEGLSDVSDGHDGFVATLSSQYAWQVSDPFILSFGVSTSWADNDYMRSFFDVDAGDSARSGLKQYKADDGFKDVGCSLKADYIWSDNWSTRVSGSYKRLVGDAEDSPIVDDRGDENQFFLGVMAIFTF